MSAQFVDNRLCPILSVATLAPREEPRVLVAGQGSSARPSATACQGPHCKWFIPINAPGSQQLVGGECALALLPAALQEISRVLVAVGRPPAPMPDVVAQ